MSHADGWRELLFDNRFTGKAAGKRWLTFADGWAPYPAGIFPELEDPEAVRKALAGSLL